MHFYRFLCGKVLYLHMFCIISVFILSGRMLIKRLVWLKNFNDFLCILGEGKGCTNESICMGTHGQAFLQNQVMDIY